MAKQLDIIDPKRDMAPRDEEPEEVEEEEKAQAYRSDEKRSGVFYLVLGIIAVAVAAGLALYILFKDNGKTTTTATATPTASATVSTTPSATTTVSATTTATAASAFKYTDQSIRISNGNGISGEGAKVKAALEAKGYKIASVGNASKTYTTSYVYYKAGQSALAEALKKDLPSEYNATQEENNAVVGSYDAVIVLGSKQ